MTTRTRVLLVDDHAMFRSSLQALLDGERDIEVVGEAEDGEAGVQKARELEPDVVIMDLAMPVMGGLEATREISDLELGTRILVLTVHAEEEYLAPVVEAGASGYLTKEQADTELVKAIRAASRGEVYLPAPATRLLLEKYREAEETTDDDRLEQLSERERQVLGLTAEGYSAAEIGEKLSVAPQTVSTYRSRVRDKLGLSHRADLFRFALRTGLLEAGDSPTGRTGSSPTEGGEESG